MKSTEDLISESGFSIQLNGWSPVGARSTWQQYCYGFMWTGPKKLASDA